MPALLEELALFIEPIKSGSEATGFRCRAHPRTGHSRRTLEVHRPRTHAGVFTRNIWLRLERGET